MICIMTKPVECKIIRGIYLSMSYFSFLTHFNDFFICQIFLMKGIGQNYLLSNFPSFYLSFDCISIISAKLTFSLFNKRLRLTHQMKK